MDKYIEIRILKILVLLLSVFWVSNSYAQEPEPIGIVTAVKGEVVVVSAGKSQVVEKGTNVFLGDSFGTTEFIDADGGICMDDGESFIRRKDDAWEFTLEDGLCINTLERVPMPRPFDRELREKFESETEVKEEVPSEEEFEEFPEEELPSEADLTPFGAPGVPAILQDPTDVKAIEYLWMW